MVDHSADGDAGSAEDRQRRVEQMREVSFHDEPILALPHSPHVLPLEYSQYSPRPMPALRPSAMMGLDEPRQGE